MRSTPRAPEPDRDEIDLSPYDWRRGWEAGFKAALQSVTTEQLSLTAHCWEGGPCQDPPTHPHFPS